ncbi:MAG: sulfatase [Eubacteriales bacterium]
MIESMSYKRRRMKNKFDNLFLHPSVCEEASQTQMILDQNLIFWSGFSAKVRFEMEENMKPNILYIMSDDHAANAISYYNSILAEVFQTPNLDRIGKEGCRMDAYCATNAICTPARASIMTGQYGHVNGVRTLADNWDPCTEYNLASLLHEDGYQTAMFGKWHLGCDPVGFDSYQYLTTEEDIECTDKVGEQGVYFNPTFKDKEKGYIHEEGYVTDLITEKTNNWIENRDKDKPFFMMCHHKAPHDFWEFAQRHEHLFDGVDIPVPESLFEDKKHRSEATREYGSSVTPRNKIRSLYEDFCKEDYVTGPLVGTENLTFEEKGYAAYQKYLKDYLRTVAGIDDSVGSILATLEKEGILDDTIVIYTSDQGMFLGEHDYQDKRWSFEESVRTPMMVRYPKEIPAGTVCSELMANIDLAQTLLDYAEVDELEGMQGFSCRDMIAGKKQETLHEGIYFRYWMHRAHRHDNPAHYGIRTKEYKLTFYYGRPLDILGALPENSPVGYELYDLVNDPQELHNLYGKEEYKEVAQQLKAQLKALKEQYGDTDEQYPEVLELVRQYE